MAQTLLKAVNIYKSFVGVQALKNVTFEIKSGEIHCLAGENGSGKSTLIKIISGVYSPDSGYMEFDGKNYTSITDRSYQEWYSGYLPGLIRVS
jgi:simple sugar transport system ATP-binding protein